MKPLSLNLSKMKKVSGDKNSSTFLHPSGHQMVIAHNGVSALQRKQLEKMPIQKMADGGEPNSSSINDTEDQAYPVTSPPETSLAHDIGSGIRKAAGIATTLSPFGIARLISSAAASEPAKDFANGIIGSDDSAGSQEPKKQKVSEAPASAVMGQPSADMNQGLVKPQDPGVDINKAYQQGQNAITEQQNYASDLAKANVPNLEKDMADRQFLQKAMKDNSDAFQKQQAGLMNDYANNHINPKHYVENMSTGSKIATAIGMILGGAGAGANQPNPGQEFLQKQIDRDIAAQESRMDQQKTLLGANQSLFRDNLLAQNQTRVNMNDIYDHQIQLQAAKLGTPQAKAQADAAHANFAMQNAQLLQENAIRKTAMDHLKNGGGGLTAIDLAHAKMMPEADALKEQSSIDAQNAAIQHVQEIFSQLRKEQTSQNRLANPIQSAARIAALNAQLTNTVVGADVSHRLTPESAKLEVTPFHGAFTDNSETSNKKMGGVLNLIKEHNAGLTPYMNRYSPQSLPKYPSEISQSEPIKMVDNKTGKIWLADPSTKKFVGWAN